MTDPMTHNPDQGEMVAYGPEHPDYPNEPKDYAGGKVMLANGYISTFFYVDWKPRGNERDIIGYEATPAQPTKPAQVEQACIDAVQAVIAAYCQSRMVPTPIATNIWSKQPVKDAFARLATQSPAAELMHATALSEKVQEAIARGVAGPAFDPHLQPETWAFCGEIARHVLPVIPPSATELERKLAIAEDERDEARLFLSAIKVITATAKDGPRALSRIMALTREAGIVAQYTDLNGSPFVAAAADLSRHIVDAREALAQIRNGGGE